ADTAGNDPEGRMINESHTSSSTTIDFMRSEELENSFLASDSSVVPAICYHLEKPGASSPYSGQPQVFTLARNSDPFLEGVEDFQVRYHNDVNSDGLVDAGELVDQLPISSYNPNLIRSIKVDMVVRVSKRQDEEVDDRSSITVGSHSLNLTTEMKHYYRRELTIDVVPRNKR
ncbi:MAG: PilW family protein, partial [Thermodesulfobacteriota bacterium]|nr:PilW family protein [Thermodesulfobacteriota bacterium]